MDLHNGAIGPPRSVNQYTFAFVDTGENFGLLIESSADSYPPQAGHTVRIYDKDARQFASLDHCRRRQEYGPTDTFIQLQSSKHAGFQARSLWQVHFHGKGVRLRVARWEDLAHDTGQGFVGERVDDDPNTIATADGLEITLRHRGFES
jgi:hypothetical protein